MSFMSRAGTRGAEEVAMQTTEARIALGSANRPDVRIFLSIASVDQSLWEPLAERLYRTLSLAPDYGFVPFDMRLILPSEDPMELIAEQLRTYHLGIGMLSTGFFASPTIRDTELKAFVERPDARFVPVMLEHLPEFATKLPEIANRQIYGFNQPWCSIGAGAQAAWINRLVEKILDVLEKYGDRT